MLFARARDQHRRRFDADRFGGAGDLNQVARDVTGAAAELDRLRPWRQMQVRLAACRRRAMKDYMEFAAGYVNQFEQKWLGGSPPTNALLGTPDLQALADLAISMNIARNMRPVPTSKRLMTMLLIVALVPMVPLLLLK
jgi:hypothetical protein